MERKDIKVSIGKGDAKREIPATKRVWVSADFPEWQDSPYVEAIGLDEMLVLVNYAEDLKVRARIRSASDQDHTEHMRTQALDWALVNDIAGFKATGGNPKLVKEYLNRVWDEQLAETSKVGWAEGEAAE